jgi:hypothetical protein
MRNLLLLLVCLSILEGCTGIKRMQTSISNAISGSEVIKVGNHEVYCSQGKVCSEVDVLSIEMDDENGGDVHITFKNRTHHTALFQARIEVRDTQGRLLDETRPENVVLPPTQERPLTLLGLARKDASVKLFLNAAN